MPEPVEALKEALSAADLSEFSRLGGNDKRLRLVYEFLRTGAAQKAYIAAGYSASHADSSAYVALKHPAVQFLLARLGHRRLADAWARLQPLYIDVVKKLAEMALSPEKPDPHILKYAADCMRPIMQQAIADADREAQKAREALERAAKAQQGQSKLTEADAKEYVQALPAEERKILREALEVA